MRLLEPIKVGKIELKNRVMFPPMTTGYEGRDGTIVEQSFNFYKRLAEGGVSYIVLGDVAPVNTISPTPKLFHDGQIEAFRKLADAVHEFDCKLGIQIFHPEYDVEALAELFRKGDMEGGRAKMRHDMVHFIQEVTEEQLNSILDKIGECVKRAQSAGVDIIEVHGDRLIGSFCSTLINRRTDSYGGSFENRIRFALRVVDKIREVAPDICIDYKLPVVTENPLRGKGGLMINEAVEFAKKILYKITKKFVDSYENYRMIKNELKKQNVKQSHILVLEKSVPWKDTILELDRNENVLYVVYQDVTGSWCTQTVPKEANSFDARKDLPKTWGGLNNDDLSKLTGIENCIFCHPALFICGNKTKEGAILMAQVAVENK